MNRSTIPSRDAQFTDLALACKRIAFLEREVEFETEEFFYHEKVRLDMIFNLMDRVVLLMKKVDGLVEVMNGDPDPLSFLPRAVYVRDCCVDAIKDWLTEYAALVRRDSLVEAAKRARQHDPATITFDELVEMANHQYPDNRQPTNTSHE